MTNPGPTAASSVTVSSTATGLTFVSNSGDCATGFPCTLGDIPPKTSMVVTSTFRASSASAAHVDVTVDSASNYNAANDKASLTLNGSSGTGGGGSSGCSAAGGAPLPWMVLVALLGLRGRRARKPGSSGPPP